MSEPSSGKSTGLSPHSPNSDVIRACAASSWVNISIKTDFTPGPGKQRLCAFQDRRLDAVDVYFNMGRGGDSLDRRKVVEAEGQDLEANAVCVRPASGDGVVDGAGLDAV